VHVRDFTYIFERVDPGTLHRLNRLWRGGSTGEYLRLRIFSWQYFNYAIVVAIFRWLWNTTMQEVFGLKELSFWQAFKIMLLAGILFGGQRAIDVPQQFSEDTAPAAVQSK